MIHSAKFYVVTVLTQIAFVYIVHNASAKPMSSNIISTFGMKISVTPLAAQEITKELEGKKVRIFVHDACSLTNAVNETLVISANVRVLDDVCSYQIDIELDSAERSSLDKVGEVLKLYCDLRVHAVDPTTAFERIRKQLEKKSK